MSGAQAAALPALSAEAEAVLIKLHHHSDWVEKKTDKWRKFWAVLRGTRIFFFKSQDTSSRDQIAGHIDLPAGTRASAGESKKKAYTFAIATTSGDHIFRVPTLTEREIWLDAILKAVTDAKRLRAGAPISSILPQSSYPGAVAAASALAQQQQPLPPTPQAPSVKVFAEPAASPPTASSPPLPRPPVPVPPSSSSPAMPAHSRPPAPLPTDSATPPARPPPSHAGRPPVPVPGADHFSSPAPLPATGPPLRSSGGLPPDEPDQSWFFGTISREQAEDIVSRHGTDCSFLLRASQSMPGSFSLSVKDKSLVRHFRIETRSGRLVLSGCADRDFGTLQELVDYYVDVSRGAAQPLDRLAVERMESAFKAPAVVREGMMLPGQRMAAAHPDARAAPGSVRRQPQHF